MEEEKMTVEEAIAKTRPPKPLIPGDAAARKVVERFMAQEYFYQGIPLMNHCACQTLLILGEVWDLPCKDKLDWIAMGLQGGVCVGEICGTLSAAAVAMGLNAWKVLEPRTGYERRLATIAVSAYQQDLFFAFKRKFSQVHCLDILGLRESTPEEVSTFIRLRLWGNTCVPVLDYVIRTLCEWGESARELPPVPAMWRQRTKSEAVQETVKAEENLENIDK